MGLTEKLTNKQIGETIKKLLQNQDLTMKQLSQSSEIDIATISRIINGKRVASIQHLEAITACFDMTLIDFIQLTNKQEEQEASTHTFLSSTIDQILKEEKIDSAVLSEKRLEIELHKYCQYAHTQEGERMIHQQFEQKLQDLDGNGHFISKLKRLFSLYETNETAKQNRLYIGAALLYVITPIDLIPDMLMPIGYIDDLLIVQLVLSKLEQQ